MEKNKQLDIVRGFQDGVANNGMEGKQMRDLYDNMVTRMAISPAPKVVIPKCLSLARTLYDIAVTQDIERWQQLTSKASLKEAGGRRLDQARLWAEKTADILRIPEEVKRLAELRCVYTPSVTEELYDEDEPFATGMSILLDIRSFEVEERVELGREALKNIDAACPDPLSGNEGTLLGVTLTRFDSGRRLLEDGRLHVKQCERFLQLRQLKEERLGVFRSALQVISEDILGADENARNNLRTAWESLLQTVFTKEFKELLEEVLDFTYAEFKASDELADVQEAVKQIAHSALLMLKPVLHPALAQTTDFGRLHDWSLSTGQARCNLATIVAMLRKGEEMIDQTRVAWRNLTRLCNLSNFLNECSEFLSNPEDPSFTVPCLKTMQKSYKATMSKSEALEDEEQPNAQDDGLLQEAPLKSLVPRLMQSPLFTAGGNNSYISTIKSRLVSTEGRPLADRVHGWWVEFFGEQSLQNISLDQRDQEQLEADAKSHKESVSQEGAKSLGEAITESMCYAQEAGDAYLHCQLQLVSAIFNTMVALEELELCKRRFLGEGTEYPDREICPEQTMKIESVRSRVKALQLVWGNGDIQVASGDATHVQTFDTCVEFGAVVASCDRESRRLQAAFRDAWTEDLQQMLRVIDTFCPKWQDKRDTLCKEKELVKQLANMKKEHYNSIGPLCKRLKDQLKLAKTFKEPAMIEASLAKEVLEKCDFAVETVAFAFFFHHTENLWLTIDNPAVAARNVDKMEKELADTGAVITDEMQDLLDRWRSGARIKELEEEQKSGSAAEQTSPSAAEGEHPAASGSAGPVASEPVSSKRKITEEDINNSSTNNSNNDNNNDDSSQ